jgi:hypothetical protein
MGLVDGHRVNTWARVDVDHQERGCAAQVNDLGRVDLGDRGNHHDAIEVLADEVADGAAHLGQRVAIHGGEGQTVPSRPRRGLDVHQHLGGTVVPAPEADDADVVRSARDEAPGRSVRSVAELRNRALHACARAVGDTRMLVDHPRHRLVRNLGGPGDIFQRGFPGAYSRSDAPSCHEVPRFRFCMKIQPDSVSGHIIHELRAWRGAAAIMRDPPLGRRQQSRVGVRSWPSARSADGPWRCRKRSREESPPGRRLEGRSVACYDVGAHIGRSWVPSGNRTALNGEPCHCQGFGR